MQLAGNWPKGLKVNKNLKNTTAHTSARRRLVHGAFAAPVALTLYSGGAFAATSLSCVVKEVRAGALPSAIPNLTPSDTFLRVRLHTLAATTTPSAWIKGSDITALQITGTPSPYITSSQWQCFVVGTPPEVQFGTETLVTPTAGAIYNTAPNVGTNTPQQNGSYVAIRIDASGKIVGVVQDGGATGNTSAVHQSCWTSFKPTP
jgi:hypothetical protein